MTLKNCPRDDGQLRHIYLSGVTAGVTSILQFSKSIYTGINVQNLKIGLPGQSQGIIIKEELTVNVKESKDKARVGTFST